jgi:hypothetical protein
MYPTGIKIERYPVKDDNVKNPMKKNSSGLQHSYFHFVQKF